MATTLQTHIKKYDKNFITNYSLFLGGLNATQKALEQYDPLKTGYARIHVGEADSPIQVLSYLQIGGLETATDELQSIKLGDVLDIDENSAHILQVMKDKCLSDFSMSIDDLLLSEVIEITTSFYYEDANGEYVFVTLPTDKYIEYDQVLHADKDKYILRYEEADEGKYVLKGGQYFYYDEDVLKC